METKHLSCYWHTLLYDYNNTNNGLPYQKRCKKFLELFQWINDARTQAASILNYYGM
ncbi:hypothetical protein GLOIN_2v1648907, partial [Rhizophagus irregularis DAOM 181602=DAOM 197198]